MVRLQRVIWSLSSWTLRVSDYPKPEMHSPPPLVLCNSLLCDALRVGSGHSKSQQKPISFYLPSPCLPGSQSMNRLLSSVLEHLLPGPIWIMKTWDKDTGWWPLICAGVVSSTEGSDSDRHSVFFNFWTCCDVPSLYEGLQPTVYSESHVCNGCLLSFFFFFLVFSCLSVCLGKEWGLR